MDSGMCSSTVEGSSHQGVCLPGRGMSGLKAEGALQARLTHCWAPAALRIQLRAAVPHGRTSAQQCPLLPLHTCRLCCCCCCLRNVTLTRHRTLTGGPLCSIPIKQHTCGTATPVRGRRGRLDRRRMPQPKASGRRPSTGCSSLYRVGRGRAHTRCTGARQLTGRPAGCRAARGGQGLQGL